MLSSFPAIKIFNIKEQTTLIRKTLTDLKEFYTSIFFISNQVAKGLTLKMI